MLHRACTLTVFLSLLASLPAVRAADLAVRPMSLEAAKQHWAFRPLAHIGPPAVRAAGWIRTPIDAFILKRLEDQGLSPSPEADRRTLARRLYFDLIGLPPMPDDLAAFESDATPNAYERCVDRLLASPRHGERWGRHWLDVARYADTKDGVLMFGNDRVRPYAYTYRDYVIRALNDDTPFDRFIAEQLAADRLQPQPEPWRLAAMGFLTLGRIFDNNPHDVIDDRIDVTTRGFLGLTVACARCHDHKYDAISSADYYALYGVFASSEEPVEPPRIGSDENGSAASEFEAKSNAKRTELVEHIHTQHRLLSRSAIEKIPDYLARIATASPDPLEDAVFFLSLSPEDLRPQILGRWRRLLAARSTPDDPVFGPWRDFLSLAPGSPPEAYAGVRSRWLAAPVGTAAGELNPLIRRALEAKPPSAPADVASLYGAALREAAAAPDAQASGALAQLREVACGPSSPTWFPPSQCQLYMSRVEKDKFFSLRKELDLLAVAAPAAPPRAMVLEDAPVLVEPRVFLRGSPARPGDRVPRQFLRALRRDGARSFADGSGRLDLARSIVDDGGALAARVIVNRVWMHHFGEPLVSTPADFGSRSSPPTHPELLDFLADELRESGWSLKALHRRIVLSSVYRQSSQDRRECRTVDPENRLLWRAQRRRLEWEAFRDTLLALSGRLDLRLYGRPVDAARDAQERRRTVYGLVDRQDLPSVFRSFDFPSPDQCAERRPKTIVPQQALFAMNSPFVLEQAHSLAELSAAECGNEPRRRVEWLHRRLFTRGPSPEEASLAIEFLARAAGDSSAGTSPGPWDQYAQVLLMTNEIAIID